VLRGIATTMLKTQPGMKEEEKKNNKDLWEISALNLLIAPLVESFFPKQDQ
jgi:hypothetical protein